MDFGLVSVVLDAIIQASAMIGEHSRRKKQQVRDDLAAVVQRLDVDAVTEAISPVRLAGFMRGGLAAANVKPIIEGRQFKGLLKELFLATVTDHSEDRLAVVRESITLVIKQGLSPAVADEDADYFCTQLVPALEGVCLGVIGKMRATSPEALSNLQQTTLLKRLTYVLENIDKNFAGLSFNTISDETRRSWLSTYRMACQRVHGYISPPDFETNRKIPMADLYVVPVVSMGGIKDYRDGTELDFESFRSSIDRTVLLGDPGGGKSTLSNFLASEWAGGQEGIVPFHVTLREYATENREQSILQYIEQQLNSRYQHPSPPGLVESLLLSGEAAVIFDGLDELIDTTKRRVVSNAVELFSVLYPLSKILVTSRRVGYDQARLDTDIFDVRVIAGFNAKEVTEYVHKWFSSQSDYSEVEAGRLSDSFIMQSSAVPDLRSNPLMLALMCIIFRGDSFIPRNRPDVYEKCATLLFEKWDGHRDIQVPLEARAHVDSAMKYVAHWMLQSESNEGGVPYDKVVREMASYLRGRAFETEEDAERASAEFVDFCKGRAWVFSDAGTRADGTALFTFTHRTFMEYFAAFHLTRINDTPEKLARTLLPRVAKEEWDVVAQLAIQIVEKSVDQGSERALTTMLDEKRKRSDLGRLNVLMFIAKCVEFATVSPPFLRRLTSACLEGVLTNIGSGEEASWEDSFRIIPWWTLLQSASDSNRSHQEAIADEHRRLVAERLSKPVGSLEWNAARRAIFLGQDLSWPWFVRGQGNVAVWTPLFSELARMSPAMADNCLNDISMHADAVVAGIISPSAAIDMQHSSGMTFSSTYFGFYGSSDPFWATPSLGHAIMLVAAHYEKNAGRPEVDFIHELSERFLLDFWAGRRGTVNQASSFQDDGHVSRRFNSFGAYADGCTPELIEAAMLAGLAQAEAFDDDMDLVPPPFLPNSLLGQLWQGRRKNEEVDLTRLVELGVPDRATSFVRSWVKHEVNVFDGNPATEQR